ncbi:hypothetical protein Q3C01_29630 [Bradyrhizobium sp. UFLA05-109]
MRALVKRRSTLIVAAGLSGSPAYAADPITALILQSAGALAVMS